MKTTLRLFHTAIRPLALLAISILAPFLDAQVFIGNDNFNDNTLTLQYEINGSLLNTQAAGQWRGGTAATGATWTETNQRMEYTTNTAAPVGSSLSGYLTWISPGSGTNAVGNVGLTAGNPYASSWVAQVQTTAMTTDVTTGYLNAGLLLYSMTSTSINNATYALYLAGGATGTSNVVLQIDTLNAGGTYDTTQASFVTSDTTDVMLRLSYDGTTHLLTPSYSLDGSTYIDFSSYDLAGAYGGTTIPPYLNGFGLQLYGGAANGAGPVTSGMITFDNLSVSAVPEPSTYAALAGLAALGLVVLRRRRAA